MRFFVDGTNFRILLEAGDKRGNRSFNLSSNFETQQFGYVRHGVTVWEDKRPLPNAPASLFLEPKPSGFMSISSSTRFEPEPDSDSDLDEDPNYKPAPASKQKSTLKFQVSRQEPNVWRLIGTGKNSWANGLTYDLSGLSGHEAERHKSLLRSLRTKWNKGKELVPVADNRSDLLLELKDDPNTKFFVFRANGQLQVRLSRSDYVEVIKLNATNWVARDKHGRNVKVGLSGHPQAAKMSAALEKMKANWSNGVHLVPVLHNGVWKQVSPDPKSEGGNEEASVPPVQTSTVSSLSSEETARGVSATKSSLTGDIADSNVNDWMTDTD